MFYFSPPLNPLHPAQGMEDNPTQEENMAGLGPCLWKAKQAGGIGRWPGEAAAAAAANRSYSPLSFRLSSSPHFSSPPTFSTLFPGLPLGASPPFRLPPPLFSPKPFYFLTSLASPLNLFSPYTAASPSRLLVFSLVFFFLFFPPLTSLPPPFHFPHHSPASRLPFLSVLFFSFHLFLSPRPPPRHRCFSRPLPQ